MAKLWLLIFSLLNASQALANMIFINNGYCELQLFRISGQHNKQKKHLGVLFPGRSARFLGNLTVDFAITWPHQRAHGIFVPSLAGDQQDDPSYDAAMFVPETPFMKILVRTKRVELPFHPVIIQKDDLGEECASPPYRPPANIWFASLVLMVFLGNLVASMLRGTAFASNAELLGWCLVLVLYYPFGFMVVYNLSWEYYRSRVGDLPGIPVWNPVDGDRRTGLHKVPLFSTLFGGRRWDLKDRQLRDFVESFPLLFAFALLYVFLKWSWNHRGSTERSQWGRASVTLLIALVFLGYLHEAKLLLILCIAIFNFLMNSALGLVGLSVVIPAMSWLFGLACLATSAEGFLTLQMLLHAFVGPAAADIGATLDGFKGEVGWHAVFNFVVLRMISWSCDFSRCLSASTDQTSETTKDAHVDDDLSELARVEVHRSRKEYLSLFLYLSYILYPPLYLTGPIITFNAFASYMKQPQQICTGKKLGLYALRWLFDTVVLMAFGHFIYTFAISVNSDTAPFDGDMTTTFDLLFAFGQYGEGMIWYSHWALKGLWLKFLVIWRFARLWALVDGICPPENMNRCMHNNYTVRGFWRAWHRSFNRWLVRYMYVPMVGSRKMSMLRKLASTLVVFMFVVVWHEPVLLQRDWAMGRVLAWGLLMALFMAPEMIVQQVCGLPRVQRALAERPVFSRHLQAAGGALCIEMLMLSNLIGYGYGLQGAEALLKTCSNMSMLVFLLARQAWLFSNVQLMIVIRRQEGKVVAKNF